MPRSIDPATPARPHLYGLDPPALAPFRDRLRTSLGVPVARRYSGGATRHAGCGMLAGRRCG